MSTVTCTGIFSWPAPERRSDRYGLILISDTNYDGDASSPFELDGAAIQALSGQTCNIKVTVLETRKSGHLGDLFRSIYPTKPEVGEVINLGIGGLFAEWVDTFFCFGLKPADGRPDDWFDPKKLYRLHDQTVKVEIVPVQVKDEPDTDWPDVTEMVDAIEAAVPALAEGQRNCTGSDTTNIHDINDINDTKTIFFEPLKLCRAVLAQIEKARGAL